MIGVREKCAKSRARAATPRAAQETTMLREWLVKKLDVLARPTENPAIQAFTSAWAGHGPPTCHWTSKPLPLLA